jgi:WhiB family redox-sensing transcriptional regulator
VIAELTGGTEGQTTMTAPTTTPTSQPADDDWWLRAACRGSVNPDMFFPTQGRPEPERVELCQGCPVRADCLREGLDTGSKGIWGGTTERQRRKLKETIPSQR